MEKGDHNKEICRPEMDIADKWAEKDTVTDK
jgi:hypothetical protein